MRKTNFSRYFSWLMLALFLVSGTSVYAQEPTITRYGEENNYYLSFDGLGLRMIADGPETVVTNSKGQSATIAELEKMGEEFEFALPFTIKNAKCENTLVAVLDKSETSREDIVKKFTEYMFEGNIIRKNDRVFDVEYRIDDSGSLIYTDITFATHQKEAQYEDRYVVKKLYDIQIIPAYVIIETKQNPSATIAAIDSVVNRNYYEKGLAKPELVLTKEQADSIGDGYDLLPLLVPEVAALFEKHDIKRIPTVEEGLVGLAHMYNEAVGHFPPTFTATHKELVAREEAKKQNHHFVEPEPHNVSTAPTVANISVNQKPKNSKVTVTATPARDFMGPQFDRNGRPVVINPMQKNQRMVGSGVNINFKW